MVQFIRYNYILEEILMKKIAKILALCLAAVMIVASFAACSKSEDDKTTTDTKKDEKTWIIATDTVFKPFESPMLRATLSVSTLTFSPPSQRIRDLNISSTASAGTLPSPPARQVRPTV